MKTFIVTILLVVIMALSEVTAFLYLLESDSEVLWRLSKDWFFLIGALLFICGIVFAAWRGNDYKELRNLATTRLETINDLRAEVATLEAKILLYQHLEEIERSIELRRKGDRENIHRSEI